MKDGSIFNLYWPCQAFRSAQLEPRALAEAVVDGYARHRNHVLPFPVADKVERLQGADDVLRLDGRHVADEADR